MEKYEIRDDRGNVLTVDFSNAKELDIFTNALDEYEYTLRNIRKMLLKYPSTTRNYRSLLTKLTSMLRQYVKNGYKTDAIIYISSQNKWVRR